MIRLVIQVVACFLVVWCCVAHAEPGTVLLRGGRIIDADIVTPSSQSLAVVVAGQKTQYGWDRIADVRGPASAEVRAHLELAETAWRGLARLERGDIVAAEPLLERAFAELGTQVGLTSKAVATGLLTCRVARGAQALAVEPFLCVMLNSTNETSPEVLDDQLRLCVSLPPIWSTESGLSSMSSQVSADGFAAWDSDRRTRQLAELYVAAAEFQISGQAQIPSFEPADDGVRFISEIVQSRIGDAQIRDAARQQLEVRSSRTIPNWQRAWIHAAAGLSLLLETDSRSKRLGIVQLLHVPALYHKAQPYLAGVCLSQAAMALDQMGREHEAILLAAEFQRVYRTHDAGQSAEMKQLIRKANERVAAEAPSQEDA